MPIPGNTDTSINIYYFEHTYPSPGSFTVSFIGENRNAGSSTWTSSDCQTFYISTTITIDPALGRNHSPVLTAPAFDKAGRAAGVSAQPCCLRCRRRLAGVPAAHLPAGAGWHRRHRGPALCRGTGNNQPAPQTCTDFRFPNDPAHYAA